MYQKILTKIPAAIQTGLIILLLGVAIIMLGIRLILPMLIVHYDSKIEQVISDYTKHEVSIDMLQMTWQQWSPRILMTDIHLMNNDQLIHFNQTEITLDVWASITEQSIQLANINISGIRLKLIRTADNRINIDIDHELAKHKEITNWLLNQKNIQFSDTTIDWYDQHDHQHITLNDAYLNLKNSNNLFELITVAKLSDQQKIELKVTTKNKQVSLQNFTGDIYAKLQNIAPNDLLKDFPVEINNGTSTTKIWATIKSSQLETLAAEMILENADVNIQEYAFNDVSLVTTFNDVSLTTTFNVTHDNDDRLWHFDINLEKLYLLNTNWQDIHGQLIIQSLATDQQHYTFKFDRVELDHLLLLSHHLNKLPFKDSMINGELINSQLFLHSKADHYVWSYQTTAKDLTIEYQDITVSSLDVEIKGDRAQTLLTINSDAKFFIQNLYNQPINLPNINGYIVWDHQQCIASLEQFNIQTKDFLVNLEGYLSINNTLGLNITTDLKNVDISILSQYVPKLGSGKFNQWLDRFLVSGKLVNGNMTLNIEDFPFKQEKSHFEATLNIEDGVFQYHSKYPSLHEVNAEFNFTNDSLVVNVNDGLIFNKPISRLTATIDYIKRNALLKVNGAYKGAISDIKKFIQQSPLNKSSGLAQIARSDLSGDMSTTFDFDLLIGRKVNRMNGAMTIENAAITVNHLIPLKNINGQMSYNLYDIWGDDIQATYYDNPIVLTIPYRQATPKKHLISVSTVSDDEFLVQQLLHIAPSLYHPNIKDWFSGRNQLSIDIYNIDTKAKKMVFKSDLKGMEIKLPYPLGKPKHEIKPIEIATIINDPSQRIIDVRYDSFIHAHFNRTDRVTLISVNDNRLETPKTESINIFGHLEQLDVSAWYQLIKDAKPQQPIQSWFKFVGIEKNKPKPLLLDIKVAKLHAFNQYFADTQIKLNHLNNQNWKLDVHSDDIEGTLSSSSAHKIQVNLKTLALKKFQSKKDQANISLPLTSMPDLSIAIDQFYWNDALLGSANMQLYKQNMEHLGSLSIGQPEHTLHIKSDYQWSPQDNQSHINATIQAEETKTVMSLFTPQNDQVKDGAFNLEMNGNWMGSLFDLSLSNIKANTHLTVGKGQLLQIEQHYGRLIGLFNIDSVLQRLTLDFSDVYSQGYSFNQITGHFKIEDGHAYNNNIEILSNATNMNISGRIGLVTKDYDQTLTVSPMFFNTLPMIGVLAGPIGIGIGATFFMTGKTIFLDMQSNMDTMFSKQYHISGSWKNPIIEKIK